MSGTVSKIKYAMSLRTPQEEALSYLDAISTHCDYKRDDKETVEAAASEYSENNRKVRTKFDFPSFCYAMATGIGKTRLLDAALPVVADPFEAAHGQVQAVQRTAGHHADHPGRLTGIAHHAGKGIRYLCAPAPAATPT